MKDPIKSGADIPDLPHYQIHIYVNCDNHPIVFVYGAENVWLNDLKEAHELYYGYKDYIVKSFHVEYTAYTEPSIEVIKRTKVVGVS